MTFDRNGRGPRMASLMGIVMAFAIGFGAIKSPSWFLSQLVVIATVATLIVAALGAIYCEPKPFWFGFAAVGWASLLLSADFWSFDQVRPWVLGAAIFHDYDPDAYRGLSERFYVGNVQFRMTVLTQVALAQGLIGGLVCLGLAWGRNQHASADRWNDVRPVTLTTVLFIASTILAMRFRETLAFAAYVQFVTTTLVVATLGVFVGRHRWVCAIAAILGWCVLAVGLLGPERVHKPRDTRPVGMYESIYLHVYPETLVYDPVDEPDSGLWIAWRNRIFGDGPSLQVTWTNRGIRTSAYGWEWWRSGHYEHFAIVAKHAACLLVMTIVMLIGFLTARSRRREGQTP